MKGTGTLGNIAVFVIALIGIAMAIHYAAPELEGYIGYLIGFLLALYAVKAIGGHKLGSLTLFR